METYALVELTYKTQIPEWFILDAFKPYEKLCYVVDGHVFIKATLELLNDLQTAWISQKELEYWMFKKMEAVKKLKELRLSKLN